MSEPLFILICIVFLFLILIPIEEKEEFNDSYNYSDNFPKEKKEKMYHPTTGYSCDTREQMDTYIKNRERKLREEQ